MKNNLVLFIIVIYSAFGCSREDLNVQIIRNPVISFNTDSTTWKADQYFFTGPARVVVYPFGAAQPGVLYNRFTLQSSGRDSRGNLLQLNMTFDAVDTTHLPGIYKLFYTAEKGLHGVELYNVGTVLSAYSICPNDSIMPVIQVQKQSTTERLISGSFQMTVCNNLDTSQKIRISNGIMTDIHY